MHATTQAPGVRQAKLAAASAISLVAAPAQVRTDCERTASELHYPVSCPALFPREGIPTPIIAGPCKGKFRGRYLHPGCDGAARYAFSSIDFPAQSRLGHLVFLGTPVIESALNAVYAPISPPVHQLAVVSRARIGSSLAECVRVPRGSDSAFGGHLVWVWDVRGHTYAVGFHGYDDASRISGLHFARATVIVP